MTSRNKTIFLHIPAYREPELIPTIEDALAKASYPDRVHFGIFRQYHPDDGFDNLDSYKKDARFAIAEIPSKEAQGLAFARALINEQLLQDQDYILQLDSHHRFVQAWDELLLDWHQGLENQGYKPIIGGYMPSYAPHLPEHEWSQEPWLQRINYFFPWGTLNIQPIALPQPEQYQEPVPARFLSGHFSFARSAWAREIRHDPHIYFSGEEISLTIRSFTHGYDLFHPHRLIAWHDTMRESRQGKLAWDDLESTSPGEFSERERSARARIQNLLGLISDESVDHTGYELGTARRLADYERYAGIRFRDKRVQRHTFDAKLPPNPIDSKGDNEDASFKRLYYHHLQIDRSQFPRDDYDQIVVSLENEFAEPLQQWVIDGERLAAFMSSGEPISGAERFLSEHKIERVVVWGHSMSMGWVERVSERIPA